MVVNGDAEVPGEQEEWLRHVLLPVKNEAAAVIAEMRQNAKWAAGPGSRALNPNSDGTSNALLDSLVKLRFSPHHATDGEFTPMAFLQPFLAIITGAEASGPITAAALTSVRRLLACGILACFNPADVAAAMHSVVAALTMCKFEATDPTHDQMVLCKILHTLDTCLECPTTFALSDADVCAIFQAAYRIGFDTQVFSDISELLTDLVRDSMTRMIRVIFGTLPDTSALAHTPAPTNGKDSAKAPDTPIAPPSPPTPIKKHGEPAAIKILHYLLQLFRTEPIPEFLLQLIQEAVAAAGPRIVGVPHIMQLLQIYLIGDLLGMIREAEPLDIPGPKLPPQLITAMSNTVLAMYLHARARVILQVEVFMQCILLPLATGKLLHDNRGHTPSALVEAAHECLVDFCLLPGFLSDAYACLDCRVECSNLFEDVCKVLASTARPRASVRGLLPYNAIALRGLVAIFHALWTRDVLPETMVVPPECLYVSQARSDLWPSIVAGEAPLCESMMTLVAADSGGAMAAAGAGDTWDALCAVRRMQWEKVLKVRLDEAVDQFNKDYKKGFQYMQVHWLLPDPLDAQSVAAMLRYVRGVNKGIIGEFMGKNAEFNQEVLTEYVRTFPFERLSFDNAFRAFADTFKQPPESQQVVRFTKTFVKTFLEAHNGDYRGFRTVKCLDDFMTVCLWHNSTWYNANPKVPKMSTVQMFKDTMSESISEHDEPEDEVFADMYNSVVEAAFPQGNNNPFQVDMPLARLTLYADRSRLPRGQVPAWLSHHSGLLYRDMFQIAWGPSVRSIWAVLEQVHPEDSHTIVESMRALRAAAAISKSTYMENVIDMLVDTLSSIADVIQPSAPYSATLLAFAGSHLVREAVTTLFAVVTEYADMVRRGWLVVLNLIMRLHKLRLLEPSIFVEAQPQDGEDTPADPFFSADLAPVNASARGNSTASSSSANLFGFFFGAAPSGQSPGPGDVELSPAELRAEERARECVSRARIGTIFDDSKFLGPDALTALITAVTAVGGNVGPPNDGDDVEISRHGSPSSSRPASTSLHAGDPDGDLDLDAAEASLELLLKLSVRNRDRIQLILPILTEHLGRIVDGTRPATARLTQRAVGGVLRVATRLLMYRQDITAELIKLLRVLLVLETSPDRPSYIYALAPVVARSLGALMSTCAHHVQSEEAWAVLLQLLRNTASHPAAVPYAVNALRSLTRSGEANPVADAPLSPENFNAVVGTVQDLVRKSSDMLRAEHSAAGSMPFDVKLVREAVDLLEALASWLQTWRQRCAQAPVLPASVSDSSCDKGKWYSELSSFWQHLIDGIASACTDWNSAVRDHAMVVLHRCLTHASENLHLSAATWGVTWRETVLPMLAALAGSMQESVMNSDEAGTQGLVRTMCLAINVVHKAFSAHTGDLSQLTEWRALWIATLQGMKACTTTTTSMTSQEVHEAVVQAIGGMIQTLHARKLLTVRPVAGKGPSMWDHTFSIATEVSPELTPGKLGVH